MSDEQAEQRANRGTGRKITIFLHPGRTGAPETQSASALEAAGFSVFHKGAETAGGGTRNGLRALGALLLELQETAPDQPVILMDATLAPDAAALERLARFDVPDQALVRTALSNADESFNPFAGLEARRTPEPETLSRAVAWMGAGSEIETRQWPGHLAVLSPGAVALLARETLTIGQAPGVLHAGGGKMVVDDTVFLHTRSQALFESQPLQAHEQPRPAAWGSLVARLYEWLQADAPMLPEPGARPATLHVSHSWGGGVSRWIEQFIDASGGTHLRLIAEGPRSGQGCGQQLALYVGNHETAIGRWWLQPPIESCQSHNAQYRDVLAEIARRHRVGRVFISSLIGHTLDALRTGIPTVQVLHDQFPLWPFLSENPLPWCGPKGVDRERAASDLAGSGEFRDLDATAWKALASDYTKAVAGDVRLVAPTRSVAETRKRLDPEWPVSDIASIPHGSPPLAGEHHVRPRPRVDGRLRLLVPGRIQPGKGQTLLRDALEEITPLAQVYLVGTGKSGEAFFGLPGVNVITEYDRDDLAEIVAQIGPHLAALLSVVPETFSYTLSEMQRLAVPCIATRLGSFPERITHGQSGWLIEPTAEALITQLKSLSADRDSVERVRAALTEIAPFDMESMIGAYDDLCPPDTINGEDGADGNGLWRTQAASESWLETHRALALRRSEDALDGARREIDRRTAWALDVEKTLESERARNARWVESLQAEQARLESMVRVREARLAEAESRLDRVERRARQVRQELENLKEVHAQVLASSSWRITRPFRVIRRTAHNFVLSRAWNPLRWPLLLSALVRNLSTVGLRGTLMRLQYHHYRSGRSEDLVEPDQIGDPLPPARLPVSGAPRASVVIPIHNQWVHTAACLRSLAEASCDLPFEVIVVDDASTDDSWERLAGVEGLTRLRNEVNAGFIESCNRGAESARGKYIVMLNNDTQVTDGWLDALADTFERHPDAGLVGSRLVYPDGRLQECGGIVFADGSGWNYGRGQDPSHPSFNHVRDADYCSGASFMIEAALFRELGGFDTLYRPAYYEDTDLAFRVRAAGRRVLVQPASTVIHHEGASSGTDMDSGIKAHQVSNRQKFLQRWIDELARFPARIDDPTDASAVRRARDHALRGRVLIIDATTPEPDQDSGSLRLTNIMRCFLDLGFGVTFYAENHAHAGRYTRELQSLGVETWYEPWLDSDSEFLRNHGPDFDLVMVSRHYVAANFHAVVRRHCPRARFVFDTVDLHYLREQRLAELESSATLKAVAAQTRRSELSVIAESDAVLVVSEAEVEVLSRDAPDALVHVLSNVHEVPGRQKPFEQRTDLFFVGGFQHPPNVDAMRWFVHDIWPLIHAELPDVNFHLIGSKAPDEIRELNGNGVIFHGFVEDLEPYLDGCRMAVAPLRYGAGVKGKVNMSMSHGQPVVATSVAVEGIHAEHERDVLIADDAAAFAREVVRLYRDQSLWERLSDAAVENVESHFSIAAARASLESLLARLEIAQD